MFITGREAQRLEEFLTTLCSGPSMPAEGILLRLYHVGLEDDSRLLRELDLAEPPTPEDAGEIADKLDQDAREDAESLGLTFQRYLLRAYDRKTGKEVGSVGARYSGASLATNGSGFADSVPPNERGQRVLCMHHVDKAYHTMVFGIGMAFEQMNRQSVRNEAMMEKMTQAMGRSFELRGQAAEKVFQQNLLADTRRQEAELALRKEEARIERDRVLLQAGVDKLVPLIPIFANRLLGKNGAVTEATPRDQLVDGLFKSLTPEQQQVLRQTLSDSQMAVVVEIAESLSNVGGGEQASNVAPKRAFEQMKEIEKQVTGAVNYFRGILLPWAVGRLERGERLDPRLHSAEAGRQFDILLKSLSAEGYAAVLGPDSPLGDAERKAFAQMAEAMTVPKRKKPRVIDPMHRDILEELGFWLGKAMKSEEAPFRLATSHLGEHLLNRLDCKLCGVAKAIIDCFSSLREHFGYELIEAIRKSQQDLVSMRGRIEEHVASFCTLHVEKERVALDSEEEVADVLVLQPNQVPIERAAMNAGQEPTIEGTQARLGSILGPLEDALRKWELLLRALAAAESRLAGGVVTPSLAERRDRWPSRYVETKVDCYLTQHGWTPREIYVFYYGKEASQPSQYKYIDDRVRHAKKSGKPPLIWGWPNEKNEQEARRLLDLILAKIAQQYDSRN